jgi:alkyl hydroperoxide reductase subunit D
MNLDQFKDQLPEFAKDIRLNISNLFGNVSQSGLTESQFYGTALAIAYALRNPGLISAIQAQLPQSLEANVDFAARTAATLMAMNNVYYRFIHLAGDGELSKMPANLRMNGLRSHGVDQVDFELYSVAVSAINGCGLCITSHLKQLLDNGVSRTAVQSAIRLAATLSAADQAISIAG